MLRYVYETRAGIKQIAAAILGLHLLFLPVFALAGELPGENPEALPANEIRNCITYPVAPMPPLYYGRFLVDRLEYIFSGQDDKVLSYEATGWYGGDYQRFWIETEGDHDTGSAEGGEIERLDLLYGRLVSAFWNARAGIGYRGTYGPDSEERFFAVFGLKGLAPFMFEIDTNIRISDRGEVLLDLEAEYDIYLTQRWVIQPRMDASYSFNEIKGLGIGPGFPGIGLGARLRYEIRRQIAPYIGLTWSTMTGGSRDMAREEAQPRDSTRLMAGIKFWF